MARELSHGLNGHANGVGPWLGPDGAPCPAYTKGAKAPWRGGDGTLADPHSRVGRLASRIEQELRQEYDASTPLATRQVRQAARLLALSERTLVGIGSDAKCTRRAVTALSAAADRQLAKLARRPKQAGPSLAELLGRSNGAAHDEPEPAA